MCTCLLEWGWSFLLLFLFFFQAEDGIRDRSPSRGLGDVYKRQVKGYVRFAYCIDTEKVKRSLPALEKLAAAYRK